MYLLGRKTIPLLSKGIAFIEMPTKRTRKSEYKSYQFGNQFVKKTNQAAPVQD